MSDRSKFLIVAGCAAMVAMLLLLKHIDDRSTYMQQARAQHKRADVLLVDWDMNIRKGIATLTPHDLGCSSFVEFYGLTHAEQHRILSDVLCCKALRHQVVPIRWQCY